jgi:hypothetical protein
MKQVYREEKLDLRGGKGRTEKDYAKVDRKKTIMQFSSFPQVETLSLSTSEERNGGGGLE